jgi:hypothetical protein
MNPLLLLLLSLAATQPDPALLAGLEYRQLHLARGGLSTAVTGVAADPFTFYFGGIGGGVWKSTNAGTTWRNVSDRYFEAAAPAGSFDRMTRAAPGRASTATGS